MFGKKTKTAATFDEKVKAAKYERLLQTLKEIVKYEAKTTTNGKEEINYIATCSAIKAKARLTLDFVADLDKDDKDE